MSRIYGALLLVLLACDPADASPPVAPVTAVSATPVEGAAVAPPASTEPAQSSNVMNIMLRGDGTAEIDGK